MNQRPLTDEDARALGWRNLQHLADYVTVRLGVDDATTKKAMEDSPDAWRGSSELRRQ